MREVSPRSKKKSCFVLYANNDTRCADEQGAARTRSADPYGGRLAYAKQGRNEQSKKRYTDKQGRGRGSQIGILALLTIL